MGDIFSQFVAASQKNLLRLDFYAFWRFIERLTKRNQKKFQESHFNFFSDQIGPK